MKYKLLKDLPTIKAGAIFQEITREVDGSKILKEYDSNNKNTMLVSEINNFDEWFEEIKEPVDSINWKPKKDDEYYCLGNNSGRLFSTFWTDTALDDARLRLGNVYRTMEEAKKAKERRLAKIRLQRTSDFKPDFENGNGGWVVFYNYLYRKLYSVPVCRTNAGEPVRYATEEDAEKSIEENERDWKIYFGIKEEE